MARILITGGRAPVALDLCRAMSRAGHQVYVADTHRFNLSNASNSIKKSFFIRPPKYDSSGFASDIIKIIKQNNIQLVIPTCEEIFYLAQHKDHISKHARLLCEDIALLNKLHNKYLFQQEVQELPIYTPQTHLLSSKTLEYWQLNPHSWVFKPVYSRFGEQVLINATTKQITKVYDQADHWLAQEFISGAQYCSYSVCQNGQLTSHISYLIPITKGFGTGICFESEEVPEIDTFVINLAAKYRFTGQIAFDYVYREGKFYVLECNPRSTSGAHLLVDNPDFVNSLLGNVKTTVTIQTKEFKQIELAMLTLGIAQCLSGRTSWQKWWQLFSSAQGCVWSSKDPLPFLAQFPVMLFYFLKSLALTRSLASLTTEDIEWNGLN